MRVLVTGSEGYLGVLVVEHLRAAGHEVHGLDTGYYRGCTLGPEPVPPPSLDVDLRDVEVSHLQGFDAVVHLAALSNDPVGELAPGITDDINHLASVRLARAAADAGVSRFLYSSTCSVYGVAGTDGLVDEDAPLRPVTAYAVSKIRVEEALSGLADSDFTPVSLRNATAYGFSPRLRCDIVLNNLVAWAHTTGEVRVLSDGTPWRPLVHGRDIADAFTLLLTADRDAVHDRSFNIGSEAGNVQVRDVAQAVVDTVPGSRLTITGETGSDPRSYRVDFSRLRRAVPTFSAHWTVRRGAAELLEAYRRHGLTEQRMAGEFTRLARLRALQEEGRLDGDLRWVPAGLTAGEAAPAPEARRRGPERSSPTPVAATAPTGSGRRARS